MVHARTPLSTLSRGSILLLILPSPSHSINMKRHTALGAPLDDMIDSQSVVGVKSGDSGVVIRYPVDQFTHTWSAEYFTAISHTYPDFISKVSL